MKEEILHYVWQQQAFSHPQLQTTAGQSLRIRSVGILNVHAGPDFSLAHLNIDDIAWHGSVEIHIKASDWNRHGHQHDPAYNSVVLHVVWQYDQDVYREDGTLIPTLELKAITESSILFKAQSLLNSRHSFIPCAQQISRVPIITKIAQIERAAAQRLERKANEIVEQVEKNLGDWEETAYQWLLKGFGFKVNQEGMFQLAQALPLRWVKKWNQDTVRLEHALLKQADLTKYFTEDKSKYLANPPELTEKQFTASVWRYSRMRPTNFPHIRIKQVAQLLGQWRGDVGWLVQILPLEEYTDKLHLRGENNKAIGKKSVETLIINTLLPLLTAYGMFHHNNQYEQHAWQCLRRLSAENNRITRSYVGLEFPNESALDTQGMLELYHSFCTPKQCLKCSIGAAVMKKHHLFVS